MKLNIKWWVAGNYTIQSILSLSSLIQEYIEALTILEWQTDGFFLLYHTNDPAKAFLQEKNHFPSNK